MIVYFFPFVTSDTATPMLGVDYPEGTLDWPGSAWNQQDTSTKLLATQKRQFLCQLQIDSY